MRPMIDKAWEDDMRRRIADNQQRVEEARQTIRASEAIDNVQKTNAKLRRVVDGKENMSKEQILAAKTMFEGTKILLSKVMPDQKVVEHTASGDFAEYLAKARERAASISTRH